MSGSTTEPANPLLVELTRVPPEGAEVRADLTVSNLHLEGEEAFVLQPGGRFEGRVDRGDEDALHVVGRLAVGLRLECGRCLDLFDFTIGPHLDLYFLPQAGGEVEEEEVELKERELVIGSYRGGRLDLGEVFREQLFLALPLKRLCREDCRGLCPNCGINWNQGSCECRPEVADLPFSGLGDLRRPPKA